MPKMTNLESLRGEHGLSRNALAVGVGVSRTTIVKLETGETEEPTYSLVMDIADFLGVEPKSLFSSSQSVLTLQNQGAEDSKEVPSP